MATSEILLTLDEAADLARVDPQILRNWAAAGIVVPAVPGGKGRGRTHRFTSQQVVDIAALGVLSDAFSKVREAVRDRCAAPMRRANEVSQAEDNPTR